MSTGRRMGVGVGGVVRGGLEGRVEGKEPCTELGGGRRGPATLVSPDPRTSAGGQGLETLLLGL